MFFALFPSFDEQVQVYHASILAHYRRIMKDRLVSSGYRSGIVQMGKGDSIGSFMSYERLSTRFLIYSQ